MEITASGQLPLNRIKVVIVKNWRKYGLPHMMCGFVDENDFLCFTSAMVCFGDGSWIEVKRSDQEDLIMTNIPASAIPE
jgi:hypothetical protein